MARYEVRYFILPASVTPKESRHLVNQSVIEHLARAGFTPAMQKGAFFIDQASALPLLAKSGDENFDQVVRQSDLFGMLGDKGKAKIAEASRVKTLSSGEVLYRQGVQGTGCSSCWRDCSVRSTLSRVTRSAKVEQIESGRHFGEECVPRGQPVLPP